MSAVNDIVFDSILVLASTLLNAAHAIFQCQGLSFHNIIDFTHPRFQYRQIRSMFDCGGWCPREIETTSALVGHDPCMLFSIAQLDRTASCHMHLNCDKHHCVAYNIDESCYRTRHGLHCDEEDCEWLGSEELHQEPAFKSRITRILPQKPHSIPMITYRDGKINYLHVNVASAVSPILNDDLGFPLPTFVAISHVWADGLGKICSFNSEGSSDHI